MGDTDTKQLICRASQEEKTLIEQRAEEAGYSSRNEYMIETCKHAAVIPVDEGTGGAEIQALNELREEVKEVRFQVERAGINLNEITKRLNAKRAYEIIPALELRHAGEQVGDAAAVVAEIVTAITERIEDGKRRAQRRKEHRAAEVRNG